LILASTARLISADTVAMIFLSIAGATTYS
jgi:hypothetical protein